MGEKTGIAWCDSTWSPWIGCTKVSPGCDGCYAEALDKRHRYGGSTHWGPGVPRHRTSAQYWQKPLIWNRVARDHGKVHRVFPSLCDPFDNEVPKEWRVNFFELIDATPNLTWLLLTKRIGNVKSLMLGSGWPWPNVCLGASIVNQEEADRDIPKLLAVPAAKRFVSYEPALGPVDFAAWLYPDRSRIVGNSGPHQVTGQPIIDQIIVGGESSQGGHDARSFDVAWARSTIAQCRAAGVACFVKQLGTHPVFEKEEQRRLVMRDRACADPAEWPLDLRVQEFPA